MPINHDGHDHDADPATECACGEIVRDPAAHRCKQIGWIDSWQLTDTELDDLLEACRCDCEWHQQHQDDQEPA